MKKSVLIFGCILLAGCVAVPKTDKALENAPKFRDQIYKSQREIAACLYDNAINMRGFNFPLVQFDHDAEIVEFSEMTRVEWRIYNSPGLIAVYEITGSDPAVVTVYWKYPPEKKKKFKRLPYIWLENCKSYGG